jgi:hypothetical protein
MVIEVVQANGTPPYKYERAGTFYLVVDARGMNCIRFPGQPGAVCFQCEGDARMATEWLNKKGDDPK